MCKTNLSTHLKDALIRKPGPLYSLIMRWIYRRVLPFIISSYSFPVRGTYCPPDKKNSLSLIWCGLKPSTWRSSFLSLNVPEQEISSHWVVGFKMTCYMDYLLWTTYYTSYNFSFRGWATLNIENYLFWHTLQVESGDFGSCIQDRPYLRC